jgi:major inositol transporter-like SP family MFS transporter
VAELALCLGCFTVFGFSGILGDAQWRRAVEFPALPALFQLICAAFFLYESPRWLAASGKSEEAEEVADALGLESFVAEQALARDPKVRKEKAGKEAQKLVSSIAAPVLDKRQRSWVGVLLQHRRRVFLALGCAVAHNALGANIVMYYSRDVLQLAGIANSVGSQVALGVAKALGTGVAFACVDRIGRRILLIAGVAGATLGHLGLAVAFWPGNIQPVAMLAWSSLMLFLAAWDMSWASLMSVVITEVLPDDVRGLGLGASCSLYWLVSFVQAQTLESLFKRITIGGTFATYAVGSIMSLLFVLLYVPETCGRPLEVE